MSDEQSSPPFSSQPEPQPRPRSEPTTKPELLERIASARDDLAAAVGRVPTEVLARPSAPDNWSVKDLLAHVAAWERRRVRVLQAARGGPDAPAMPVPISGGLDVDRFNAEVYERSRDLPLEAVLAEFQEAHRALLAAILAVDEAALFDPAAFAWAEGTPLWKEVGYDTFWHYAEHAAQLAEAAAL